MVKVALIVVSFEKLAPNWHQKLVASAKVLKNKGISILNGINWKIYYVYQVTPYDLDEISPAAWI